MACNGRYATVQQYNDLMCSRLDLGDPLTIAAVESALDIAASDIHAALAAVGACNCTLASWADAYLRKLNIIDAAVLQNCPCGAALKDEDRSIWMDWLNKQFDMIQSGRLVLCEGETGSEYPAFGTAEIGYTEFGQAQIIQNRMQRNP